MIIFLNRRSARDVPAAGNFVKSLLTGFLFSVKIFWIAKVQFSFLNFFLLFFFLHIIWIMGVKKWKYEPRAIFSPFSSYTIFGFCWLISKKCLLLRAKSWISIQETWNCSLEIEEELYWCPPQQLQLWLVIRPKSWCWWLDSIWSSQKPIKLIKEEEVEEENSL